MTTATPSWLQARMTKARESLPRVQAKLDAARGRLGDLQIQQGAVKRAVAALDSDADPDIAVAVQVAAELLPPVVTEAETAVAATTAARREARAALLPGDDHPWSRISAARQADARSQGELDAARSRLGALQRGRAMALGVVRKAGPATDMGALAAAEAELRLGERLLPEARNAVAQAEEASRQTQAELDGMQERMHLLRLDVLVAEPEQAESALSELLGLVGEEREWRSPR